MKPYDVLIVGAGLFGSVVCREALDHGLKVLVVDRREHVGGNCYTREVEGIHVHAYGAHIFRTNDPDTWNYLQRFCEFNSFVNSPIANFHGKLYNLPFNMNTFYELWGTRTPQEARDRINETRVTCKHPKNLEEYVLDLAGRDIYEKLIKGYTEKQWGRPCSELPTSVMARIPLRFRFDNNYYHDRYQGIPIGGYTRIFEQLLEGADIRLGIDYLDERDPLSSIADRTVFTGTIDSYFADRLGVLAYRSLRFEHEVLDEENHQGVAVMNFTDGETPYTRCIEHKHFERTQSDKTVLSWEYPLDWEPGSEPYYPIEDAENRALYLRYEKLAADEPGVFFGGRLGEYRYYDMQDTVRSARRKAAEWLGWASPSDACREEAE